MLALAVSVSTRRVVVGGRELPRLYRFDCERRLGGRPRKPDDFEHELILLTRRNVPRCADDAKSQVADSKPVWTFVYEHYGLLSTDILKTVPAIVLLPVSGIRSATGQFEHERVRESRVVIDTNTAIVFHGVQRSIDGKCR